MKETFEQYLQRLKDRRTEDEYKYTDEDFKKYIYYIFDCYEKGMSVYKCLEFMYFAERDMDDQLFNRESKQEIISSEEDAKIFIDTTINVPEPNEKLKKAFREYGKQETLEEAAKLAFSYEYGGEETSITDRKRDAFMEGAKWQQEQHDFLPGFIKQFNPKEGEIDGEEWTAVQFLKWLELNKFKIVK
jgi:hypothetical protein